MGNAPGRGVSEKYIQRIPSKGRREDDKAEAGNRHAGLQWFWYWNHFRVTGSLAFLSCDIREKMGSESASLHQPFTDEGGGDIRKKRTLRTGDCLSRNHRWQREESERSLVPPLPWLGNGPKPWLWAAPCPADPITGPPAVFHENRLLRWEPPETSGRENKGQKYDWEESFLPGAGFRLPLFKKINPFGWFKYFDSQSGF